MASFASVFVRQSCYSRIMSLQTSFRQATIRNVVARSPRQGIHSTAGPGRPSFYKAFGVAGVGLGLAAVSMPTVYCDVSDNEKAQRQAADPLADQPKSSLPPPPSSIINVYELTFGSVCGICAGIFLKKGAKAVAFVFGGAFVLLQYFASFSLVRVDWVKMGSRFENLFYTTDPVTGARKAPSIVSLWTWLVEFLTADFQPRASFIAGLLLGLRIG
ncbi:FUN14 family protein [Pleurotus pulmonarius]